VTPDDVRSSRRRVMDAKGRKRRLLAQVRGEPTDLVDVAPIRANLKRLHDLGFSLESIATMNGAGTAAALRLIEAGTTRTAERKFLPLANMKYSAAVPDSLPDTALVPSLGAQRRIRALAALGWRHADISEMIGRASHHISAGRHPSMLAGDWRLVAAAYERMSSTPGPSAKTRSRARASGYAPPLAWDDIDNPDARPVVGSGRRPSDSIDHAAVERVLAGEVVPTTRAEKVEITRRWEAAGRPLRTLEMFTGWKCDRYTNREDAA
jgi:hypothetical protein